MRRKGIKEIDVYLGNRKSNGLHERAITIYNKYGIVMYSNVSTLESKDDSLKFEYNMMGIEKSVKQLRSLISNNLIEVEDKINIYIDSSIVYNWLEQGECPKGYIDYFAEVQLELSLFLKEVEIFLCDKNKVCYYSTEKKKENVMDYLNKLN